MKIINAYVIENYFVFVSMKIVKGKLKYLKTY
jgi:hypothetical protein